MKKAIFISLLVASIAMAKFIPLGGQLTSTSGAQAVIAMFSTSTNNAPTWAGVRCIEPANAQSGTVTYYSDGGMTLYSDGGVVGIYAGSADPLIVAGASERPLQLAPGENAVAVAGADGGTAHCFVSQIWEF